MTVRDLMARLERMPPSARVYLARDPRWPWEHTIFAVVQRRQVECDDRDAHWEHDDVLILEGDRAGFGPEFAWADAAKATEAAGG